MKALVVYESMFGNTRRVAESIAIGMSEYADVTVLNINRVNPDKLVDLDLLVVGAPTHAHTISTSASRKEAERQSTQPARRLRLERDASGMGVREWIESIPAATGLCAAFDTRADVLKLLSGAASTTIDKRLRRKGLRAVMDPESFLVSIQGELNPDESTHAQEWGATVARAAEMPTFT
ncbi:MAG: hypothetical protein QOD27_1537 [Microbacteriaceae bacterium]|jgi:hypothetical protein|nr:flavodoxin [Microbacteriaceae bacterium]MDQ1549879.1 hypothetical protein [Microbacteriaceae bacterium]